MDDSKPPPPNLEKTLEIPAHVSSLASDRADHLFVGAEDGTLRVYNLSSHRVLKAIRGLGPEISSVVFLKRPGSELHDVWLACGSRLMNFNMDSVKMIQTSEDALCVIDLGESEDDILGELALHSNGTHIAFSMDSGAVGVVEISTRTILRMRTKHQSVCGSVNFIPNRPRELVSGGYDMTLIHFDFVEGKVLSSCKIPTSPAAGGMAFAPPFVTSAALSSTGLIAAGTADGRLWLGCGGQKVTGKKKTRKWGGLDQSAEVVKKIAEGPLVAMAFDESGRLTISTLLGVVSQYSLTWDEKENVMMLSSIWQRETRRVKKVNALVLDEKRVVVGGLTANGKGAFEIWKH